MPKEFFPTREAEFVTWVGVFKAAILADYGAVGLSGPQAANYGTLADDFVAAYRLANADATRTPSNLVRKDQAKAQLIAQTRILSGIIQTYPGTTNEMRVKLGLNVKAARTPIPAPADPPVLSIVDRLGTRVRLRLREANRIGRGRPRGVQGAQIYVFVGPTPPTSRDGWSRGTMTVRTMVDVDFPADTPPGTVVWFAARWYNPRGETGPGSAPISTWIAGGSIGLAA